MNQSFETELQVVLRALGEVVLPALDGAEKHVVEQLHLSMAALDFMRQRLPHAGRFYRGELTAYATHADAVADLIAGHRGDVADLRAQAEAARTLLSSPAADWSDYVDATRRLRNVIACVVEGSAGAPYEADLDALVIATATDLHLQSRVWCQPFGFELKPETLPGATWIK
jgi:hypothetical protein